MANRYINNNQTVTNVVAEAPSLFDTLAPVTAEMGEDIIRKSQEAKIVENLSSAQLEIGQLSNQFQTQYEGDPFNEQGLKDFRSQRQGIIDKYGEGISPLFGRAWKDSATKLTSSNDLATQGWAYKQAEVNTKTSLINTAQNNLVKTGLDGEAFANGSMTLPEALLNIHTGLDSMRGFGNENLGATSTDAIMHDLGQDHIKTFISSVAKTNPVMALRLMENEAVKSEVTNQDEWAKFRDAVESRSIKFQEVAKQTEILDTLKRPNEMLNSGRVLSYAEILQASSGMSEESKDYFLKANGYKTGEDKLSASEKSQYMLDVYDEVNLLSKSDNPTVQDVAALQNKIYKGMDLGAITQDDGVSFINEIVSPLVDKQQKSLGELGDKRLFSDSLGFDGVQEFYDNNVKIKSVEGKPNTEAYKKAFNRAKSVNNENRLTLYNDYMQALRTEAGSLRNEKFPNGIAVGDIDKLPSAQKNKLYSEAQKTALRTYLERKHPSLKTMDDVPNQILSNGKLIQGMAGPRNVDTTGASAPNFEYIKRADGKVARRYKDGTIEPITMPVELIGGD